MNVLLMTITQKNSQKMIRDIANEFVKMGHLVFVACPADEINPTRTKFILIDGIRYLFIKSGNTVGKINIFKKCWNFLITDSVYKKALKKSCDGIDFDLILYSTSNKFSFSLTKSASFVFFNLVNVCLTTNSC